MKYARAELADVLRGRILRGLQGGVLRLGDRLPSARELEAELGTDHRVILDAYRVLAAEQLVELRQRGGIYVAADGASGAVPLPAATWLTEVLAQGVSREIPLPELHGWLHRSVATLRLKALVVEHTADQMEGLSRELREDYGLEVTALHVDELLAARNRPEVMYADVFITTAQHEPTVGPVAEELGKHLFVVGIRPDLVAAEWRLMLMRPLYVVAADEAFEPLLLDFFRDTPGSENLRTLIIGRDDISSIPDGAPVYVTQSARSALRDVQIRGRILPPLRLFSPETSAGLIHFIVSSNLRAFAQRWPPP